MPRLQSFAWIALLAMLVPAASAAEFYVAPDGDDRHAGTREEPFQSLERARDAVRQRRAASDSDSQAVTVLLRGGRYSRSRPLVLGEEDSGEVHAPIVYKAAPGEQVILDGGHLLEPAAFQPARDAAVRARLLEGVREKVLKVDLRQHGITEYGQFGPRGWGRPDIPAPTELFLDGVPQVVARWPNDRHVPLGEVVQSGAPSSEGTSDGSPGIFRYNTDRAKRWGTAEELFISGLFGVTWAHDTIRIARIDTEAGTFTTDGPHHYGFRQPGFPGEFQTHYYAVNLLEELDRPGEYYLDRSTGFLYFLPPYPLEGSQIQLSSLADPFVHLKGASHVHFEGLVFENARGTGIRIDGGQGNRVVGCTLRALGQQAIIISGGRDHSVSSCDIYYTGRGGVVLSGGDRRKLIPAGHVVSNCDVHSFNRWIQYYNPAISASGVGIRIQHNHIHRGLHQAITFSGNEHEIEFNEIHDVLKEISDMGSIYIGRNPTFAGNLIRYNFFHHLRNEHEGGPGTQAIFFDDDTLYVARVFGNVFYKTGTTGVIKFHGGGGASIANNVAIASPPLVQDGPGDKPGIERAISKMHTDEPHQHGFPQKIAEMNIAEAPYRTRYPYLYDTYAHGYNEGTPRWNNFEVEEDCDHFVDPANLDFGLEDDSPILGHVAKDVYDRVYGADGEDLPFQRIPFEEIGLRQDEYRGELGPVPFRKLGPADGAAGLDANRMQLWWTPSHNADAYHVTVAADIEMQQVLIDKHVDTNHITLATLSPGRTYYWHVEAEVTRSRSNRGSRPAMGKAWRFSSAETELQRQFSALQQDLARRAELAARAPQSFRPAALILDSDRDPADVVLRRTAALLADLEQLPGAPSLSELNAELHDLQSESERISVDEHQARYALYEEACRLRRNIAFSNPLLDFDEIVFLKRHRALFNHMCDQYYGMAAASGGGVYVLSNAFGPNPQVRDVLAEAVVQNGRLAGERLTGGPPPPPDLRFDGLGNLTGPDHEGGAFLSPDLSYDGKKLLFAYVEGRGDRRHHHHTDPARGHWDPGRCYHIFQVGIDGSDLRQLTDGTWNDFDPCWLPNGRIALVSERRGGYLRCGRVCPTYTLFDMAADGTDMRCLSLHETNEWHPSVTHDGRIIWTRWDYIDRHGCTAHMPWITSLDGTDPRPVHGNYAVRQSRPDMELNVRAIPGSQRFVATAAPHHGQAYGSLIIIDPRVPDDNAMGPVKRLTPEMGFPESQGGAQVYGTAWPLSEDYYLCVYDDGMRNGKGFQGQRFARGDYGIYLVDSFGNKELLYRDPEIACSNPIPLRPRRRPLASPSIATADDARESNPATRGRPRGARPAEATVAVLNVYHSQDPWPPGTTIKALRVLQVLPMTVPSGDPPHETGLRSQQALDSVVPARAVLGTVPVEEDGSAHFVVPAYKEIFFQALDERGRAVQSMRSGTHTRAGERLVCHGCHAGPSQAPQTPGHLPTALLREPSRLEGDVEGSNPFSYPRLVQPVLDHHCASCHKQQDTAPNLGIEPLDREWYASYNSLIEYAYTSHDHAYRTTPGQFGARAARLTEILDQGHHGVELSEEEMHRITLWLDCLSMFYGVYEREGGEAQLRGELVSPTLE